EGASGSILLASWTAVQASPFTDRQDCKPATTQRLFSADRAAARSPGRPAGAPPGTPYAIRHANCAVGTALRMVSPISGAGLVPVSVGDREPPPLAESARRDAQRRGSLPALVLAEDHQLQHPPQQLLCE